MPNNFNTSSSLPIKALVAMSFALPVSITASENMTKNYRGVSANNCYTSTSSVKIRSNKFYLEKIRRNIEILEGLKNLGINWNSYNAQPFSVNHINLILNFLNTLSVQPKIFPTGRNSIQLEYHKENGDYLEFEIFEGRTEYFSEKSSSERDGTIQLNEMNSIIEDFYA